MAKDLLLEIGTEEMPAGDMDRIRNNFSQLAQERFTEKRLKYEDISVYSTPRRLTLFIDDLAEKQDDKRESVRGPAAEIAFDTDGNPTKAGKGFACGQGMEVEELEIRDNYLYADKLERGKKTAELLPKLISEMLTDIKFPKSMRWGDIDFEFIRPIKWLVSLFGEKTINFEIAEVKSGSFSYGHRFLSEGAVEIDQPDKYFDLLEKNYIIVDQKQRKKMIVDQIEKMDLDGGRPLLLEDLLSEVVELLEYPTTFCGSFSKDYLELPEDVLITSMVEHQRYFPVRQDSGEIKNLFIGVRDGNEDYLDEVKEGNEMVLKARLADGRFFFEEDQKKDFKKRKEELKDVVFKKGLGSIYDKVERLKSLAKMIGCEYDLSNDKLSSLIRSADLCKNDLVTEMVNEFAKLQGVMGAEYALLAGEDDPVAESIREHYLPRFADDKLPQTVQGSILSIVDKLDNITSHFSQGIKPSGSQDPFALKRQAAGIVKIILDLDYNVDIDEMINSSFKTLDLHNEELAEEIKEFLIRRLRKELEERKIRYDVLNAVIDINTSDFVDIRDRAEAVMELRRENPELFVDLFRGLVRSKNLAGEAEKNLSIKRDFLTAEGEKNLYNEYINIRDIIEKKFADGDYKSGLKKLVDLKEPVDRFLDNVIVMVDDSKLKNNRLALLQRVSEAAELVMDIDKIALDD